MKKQTQCEAILAYLRKHKRATNMELVQKLWIASPWTRISEMTDHEGWIWECRGDGWFEIGEHRITRRFIRTPSGKRVVLYELVRA